MVAPQLGEEVDVLGLLDAWLSGNVVVGGGAAHHLLG